MKKVECQTRPYVHYFWMSKRPYRVAWPLRTRLRRLGPCYSARAFHISTTRPFRPTFSLINFCRVLLFHSLLKWQNRTRRVSEPRVGLEKSQYTFSESSLTFFYPRAEQRKLLKGLFVTVGEINATDDIWPYLRHQSETRRTEAISRSRIF